MVIVDDCSAEMLGAQDSRLTGSSWSATNEMKRVK